MIECVDCGADVELGEPCRCGAVTVLTTGNGPCQTYHTDAGCRGLATALKTKRVARGRIEDRQELCLFCADEDEQPVVQDRSFYEAARRA